MRVENTRSIVNWEKINLPFRLINDIRIILESDKNVIMKLLWFSLMNFSDLKQAFYNIKKFGERIPREPEELKKFVQNFNTYFDIKDDLKEEKIEKTLLLIVSLYEYINVLQNKRG